MKRPLVAAIVVAGALTIGGVVLARTTRYTAEPVGEFEVPAVVTDGEGHLRMRLHNKEQAISYYLRITRPLTDVTQAHLHMGAAGTNGPIVVWLYPDAPPAVLIPGATRGPLAKGVITPEDLRPPPSGGPAPTWEQFLAALDTGQIYVNVHTSQNPGGEIRDQVHVHGGGHD
jgi:hypothetical protein